MNKNNKAFKAMANTQKNLDNMLIDEGSLDQLDQFLGKDETARLVAVFLGHARPKLARLAFASIDGELLEVQKIAHTLKGSAGNIGGAGFSRQLGQIEMLAKSEERHVIQKMVPIFLETADKTFGHLEQRYAMELMRIDMTEAHK